MKNLARVIKEDLFICLSIFFLLVAGVFIGLGAKANIHRQGIHEKDLIIVGLIEIMTKQEKKIIAQEKVISNFFVMEIDEMIKGGK